PTSTGPALTLAVSSLTFGAQDVGTTSAAQSLTLRNSGSAAVTISSVATTGEFAQSNGCGGSLAPGAGCTVSVTFTPSGMGARSGTLTLTDDAPDSPQIVPLSGSGGIGTVALSPPNLTFGETIVDTTGTQTLSLSNSGATAIAISDISAFGDFSQT